MKIYSVRTYNDKSLVYYGYTKQPLYKRLYDYRSRYKRHLKNCDNFLIVYEILKHKNEYIVLEKELETPITIVSVGPDRKQTIHMK